MRLRSFHSDEIDATEAINEIISAFGDANETAPSAIVLMCSHEYDHGAIVSKLSSRFPGIPLVGCTSSAEVSNSVHFSDNSVMVSFLFSERTKMKALLLRNLSQGIEASVDRALNDLDLTNVKLSWIFSESLTCSADDLVTLLQKRLGAIPLIGGIASDDWKFKQTYQFFGNEVISDSAALLLFENPDLAVSFSVETGWKPLGKSVTVTSSTNNIVREIDGKKAVSFYKSVMGDHATPSGENPLAIKTDEAFYLRAPLLYNEDDSITFAGNVPQGSEVNISNTNTDAIITAARNSTERALAVLENKADIMFFVSCAARKKLLGSKVLQEIENVLEVLPASTPFFGFYAYGEICPLGAGKGAAFHNETFVCCLLKD